MLSFKAPIRSRKAFPCARFRGDISDTGLDALHCRFAILD
jgi:hypothetical protein